MKYNVLYLLIAMLFLSGSFSYGQGINITQQQKSGFLDAAEFGFSPDATGIENLKALQEAVNQGGTVVDRKSVV